jgi:hypothetical protein
MRGGLSFLTLGEKKLNTKAQRHEDTKWEAVYCHRPPLVYHPGTTSCGAFAPSRLLKLVAVLLVVAITKLYVPAPVTSAVTFTLVQVLAVMAPEVPRLPRTVARG